MSESMIIYRSFMEALDNLEPDDYKATMQAILHYGMDGEEPDLKGIGKAIFTMARPQIDANAKRRLNGGKGGRPKAEPNTEKAEPKPNQTQTKHKPNSNQTVTEPKPNVNVNVNDNVNEYINPYMSGKPDEGGAKKSAKADIKSDYADERAEVISYLNQKSGKNFKSDSASAIRFINGRLKDGYTVNDMKHVVDVKVTEWKDTEREQYLRPETLFSSTKFEAYLNQRPVKPKKDMFKLSDSMKHDYDLKELARRAKAE